MGMDFRKVAERYCALSPYEERDRQVERFAVQALPLLAGLGKSQA